MEAHWKNICKHEGHVGVSHSSELECYKLLSVLQHFSCKIKEKDGLLRKHVRETQGMSSKSFCNAKSNRKTVKGNLLFGTFFKAKIGE